MGREFALSCHLQSDCKTVREWIMRPALFLHVAASVALLGIGGALVIRGTVPACRRATCAVFGDRCERVSR